MPLSPALASRTISRRRAPEIVDPRYGDEQLDWPNAVVTVMPGLWALQPAAAGEFTDPTRTAVVTRWNLFGPPGADLRATDRVDVDGITYAVDGEPQDWQAPGGRLDHTVAVLVKVEG
jgi:hypothetical protein